MNSFIQSNNYKHKVLVVDDEAINRELLQAILSMNYDVTCASNGSEAMDILYRSKEPFSLILLDLLMPQMSGFQVLEACKSDEKLKSIPIIVMTSEKSAEVRTIHKGASDFIPKPYRMPEVILARCERIIELDEEKKFTSSIECDSATGLYIKEAFYAYIERMLPSIRLAMDAALIRIDGIMHIGRMYGKHETDKILRKTAELIRRDLLGNKGIACRMSTDTIGAYCRHKLNCEELAQQAQKELADAFPKYDIRLRAGICERVTKETPVKKWFEYAQSALDNLPEDRFTAPYTEELMERDRRDAQLIADWKEAVDSDQLILRYLPLYRLQGNSPVMCGAQAVWYWQHPTLGLLKPDDFMPLMLKNGLFTRTERKLLRSAASQACKWNQKLPIWVHVTSTERPHEVLSSLIREYSLTTDALVPIFHESAFLEDTAGSVRVIQQTKDLGFTVAMGGFGKRGLPFTTLASLPIDVYMPAASLFAQINTKQNPLSLAIALANNLNAETAVCNVTSKQELDALYDMGCTIAQGDVLSPAVTADEL